MPPAVEVWSLNHWTAREAPVDRCIFNASVGGELRVLLLHHLDPLPRGLRFSLWTSSCYNTIYQKDHSFLVNCIGPFAINKVTIDGGVNSRL